MDRTYHEQVDNGLFIIEYYLEKDYRDIEIGDLKNSIDKVSIVMWSLVSDENKPSRTDYYKLATQSYHNSFLTQGGRTKEKIRVQLSMLLENIGEDKTCLLCGEKRVKEDFLPDSINVFVPGTPSKKAFFNRANSFKTIDICGVCLFLSYVGFLNLQKVSYPFLYISDSDDFMRDITIKIQDNVAKKLLIDRKISDNNGELESLHKILEAMKTYDDIGYVDLIYFQNGKNNYYSAKSIPEDKMRKLALLNYNNVLGEFMKLRLFNYFIQDKDVFHCIIDMREMKFKSSKRLTYLIKEEFALKKEYQLAERITNKLLLAYSHKKLINKLKICNSRSQFEDFILKESEKKLLFDSLEEFDELVKRYYTYKTYIIACTLLDMEEQGIEDEGEEVYVDEQIFSR